MANQTSKLLLRLPQVKARTGQSRSSIYSKVAAGTFPAPIRLGARAVAWLADEIDQWISDRVGERDLAQRELAAQRAANERAFQQKLEELKARRGGVSSKAG